MAISQFDRPAEMQLIDTYVPIPFQELAAAGQSKQESFDRALATEDLLTNQLMETPALNEIQLPGTDTRVSLEDAYLVDEAKKGYEDRMEGLSKSYRDKASPEYQNEMRGLVREMRQAFGSQGVFGKAKSNYNEYRRVQELISKNPDILPHRLSGIATELQAGVRPGQIANLQVTSTPSKGTDVTEKLTGLLKNIKTTLNTKGTYSYRDNFGRIVDVKKEEISPQRVKEIAMAEMLTNPALQDELTNMARHSQLTGRDFDITDYVDQVGNIMGATFMQEDVDLGNKFDPYLLAQQKAGLEGESGDIPFSFEGVIQDPNRSKISSPLGMADAKSTAQERVETTDKQLLALENQLDDQGRLFEGGVDVTWKHSEAKRNAINAQREQFDLEQQDQKLKEKAGISDWQIKENYTSEQIEEARNEAASTAVFAFSNRNTFATREQLQQIGESTKDTDAYKGFLGKDKTGKSFSERSKDYKNLLETDAEFKNRNVNFNSIPGDTKKQGTPLGYLNTEGVKNFVLSGNQEVRWHESERSGALESDDYAEADPSKSTINFWGFDTRTGKGGQLIVKMDLRDAEGNKIGTAETKAPRGFRATLLQQGTLQPTEIDLEEQILGQFGPEGSYTRTGNVQVGFDNDSRFEVHVKAPSAVTGNRWLVSMPNKKGDIQEVPYDRRDQMVSALGNLYLTNLKKNQENKNTL
jgi:hypothetical protein